MNRRALFKRLAAMAAVVALAPVVKPAPPPGYADGGYIPEPHILLGSGSGRIAGCMWEYGEEVILPASRIYSHSIDDELTPIVWIVGNDGMGSGLDA